MYIHECVAFRLRIIRDRAESKNAGYPADKEHQEHCDSDQIPYTTDGKNTFLIFFVSAEQEGKAGITIYGSFCSVANKNWTL